jgi:transposase InsO family protein
LVSDQKSHFINNLVKLLVQEFMITHYKSTTYYPQGNGQEKSTNKMLKQMLTKLVNANQNDWDVMVPTALWAYRTTCKVSTQHTPYELVYKLMPLLPIEFIILTNQTLAKKDGS